MVTNRTSRVTGDEIRSRRNSHGALSDPNDTYSKARPKVRPLNSARPAPIRVGDLKTIFLNDSPRRRR
ncbi:uncharacterized protein L969DRAFT_94327 [Mixia osmundae IAM 14324]|uniref:Uncharacterized protein n=1 Tax=Mixia osmundae (strain CBS 9802 / IAM 14324 / JCM 22182 / KY 12970) TaxID=764103 RepID=G7DZS9_MIXOS|nr:uncharacterized protein L969DRAFT_94327 [Mixia osmundae IAM 14324]KEI39252.1 hypothetical protein L969DRAFT_94327 [Mixia osmundae IAM 14324]GAA96089.1 hypothetical protein E5Q_02750 [Mixia osmundae IAM 14324]